MTTTDQLTAELLGVMLRWSRESDITVMETIRAANKAAERIFQIALGEVEE